VSKPGFPRPRGRSPGEVVCTVCCGWPRKPLGPRTGRIDNRPSCAIDPRRGRGALRSHRAHARSAAAPSSGISAHQRTTPRRDGDGPPRPPISRARIESGPRDARPKDDREALIPETAAQVAGCAWRARSSHSSHEQLPNRRRGAAASRCPIRRPSHNCSTMTTTSRLRCCRRCACERWTPSPIDMH
jgi:hypothetical protein